MPVGHLADIGGGSVRITTGRTVSTHVRFSPHRLQSSTVVEPRCWPDGLTNDEPSDIPSQVAETRPTTPPEFDSSEGLISHPINHLAIVWSKVLRHDSNRPPHDRSLMERQEVTSPLAVRYFTPESPTAHARQRTAPWSLGSRDRFPMDAASIATQSAQICRSSQAWWTAPCHSPRAICGASSRFTTRFGRRLRTPC